MGLMAPAVAILVLIYAFPLLDLLRISTQRVTTFANREPVGLANYGTLFDEPLFRRALANNARFIVVGVLALVTLSVVFGSMLREQWGGWRIQRALIFLPFVLPIPVIGLAFRQILRSDGLLNTFLESVGLGPLTQNWLGDSDLAPWAILAVIIWKELGLGVLIVLGRLQSVRAELYEAAELDGAGLVAEIDPRELAGIALGPWLLHPVGGRNDVKLGLCVRFYDHRRRAGRCIGRDRALSVQAYVRTRDWRTGFRGCCGRGRGPVSLARRSSCPDLPGPLARAQTDDRTSE